MVKITPNTNEKAKEVDAKSSKDEGEGKAGMKKGPWTPAEDAILTEYVKKYGEGNWNYVQKNSGLQRCGKSCRLRWANHLRPNLKKGAFSPEEEQIIIDLHAKLGNKWAQMAAQLPGRTDNEIKNFWNTRMKRRQRAGLPLYPPELQHEATTYHLQPQRFFDPPHPTSPSFALLLSSCYPKKFNEPTHFSSTNALQNQLDSACYTNPCSQLKFPNENSGNRNLALPLSPFSTYGSSSSTLFNQSFAAHTLGASGSHDNQYSGRYNNGFNATSVVPLVQGSNTEITSSQSTPGSVSTPASSHASGVDGMMGASSMVNDSYEVAPLSPQGNSGLLNDLVEKAQCLSRNNELRSEGSTSEGKLSCKRKSMAVEEYADSVPVESAMKKNTRDTTNDSSKLSTEKKLAGKDPLEEMNSMDDDLYGLLNNYPSEMPMPEWYRRGESQSSGLETQPDALAGPTDQEFAWSLGTSWNNLPGIC